MTTSREPKKLSFEKTVVSVLNNAAALQAGNVKQGNITTLQSTYPGCDLNVI